MALVLRINKAAPLTNAEVDDNFLYLDTRITNANNAKLNVADLLTQVKLVDGVGSGLDADLLDNMQPASTNVATTIVARDASGDFSAGIITATFHGNATTATTAGAFSGIIPFANGGSGVSALNAGYVKSNGTTLTSSTTVAGADVSGNINGNAANVSGVVSVANGGTGVSDVGAIRSTLGLVINQTIQAYSTNLQQLSSINADGILLRASGVINPISYAALMTNIGAAPLTAPTFNTQISIVNSTIKPAASIYGGLSVDGLKNGWNGINFRNGATNVGTLMAAQGQIAGWYNAADNGWSIYWDNAGNFTAAGDITMLSDARLKSEVQTFEHALDTVCKLRGVQFMKYGQIGVGVIAQEVQKVLPQVVHCDAEYLSVAYGNMVGVLIEAIKELKSEIDVLKTRIQK